jgi:hypothetical protein
MPAARHAATTAATWAAFLRVVHRRCSKLRRMRRFYPEVELLLIGPKEYAAVARSAVHIAEWE